MGVLFEHARGQEKIRIMQNRLLFVALVATGVSSSAGAASAQVAGSTTLGFSVVEATRLTLGRSVKKSILGKLVYNEAGDKIGKVEDLIIAPDRTALEDKGGKLILPGATKDTIKSLPRFDYASDTTQRDQFVANAREDMAKAEAKVGDLKKKAAVAASDAKAKLDKQADGLNRDLKVAEDKLAEMNRAAARQWRDFEGDVDAAMARLRKSLEASSS
jgi:hypothetical protein